LTSRRWFCEAFVTIFIPAWVVIGGVPDYSMKQQTMVWYEPKFLYWGTFIDLGSRQVLGCAHWGIIVPIVPEKLLLKGMTLRLLRSC